MKIGIDARFYGAVSQGLGRYCEQLVTHVTKLDTHNEYLIFVLKGHAFKDLPSNARSIECSYGWYRFAEQLRWPFFLYRYKLDLMHFTSFNVPLLYRRRFVLTIHDLILIHHASSHASTLSPWHFAVKRWLYRVVLISAVRRAVHIIAVSKFTADDVRHTLHTQTPISVMYLGSELPPHASLATTDPAFSIPDTPYLLYVGNAYPHKNLDFLINNFIQWRKGNPGYTLALVGKRDYFYQRLQDAYKGGMGIAFLGSVSDAELEELYRHATVYVFPSLYEGFGIPPLEAMRFGTPVIASNASCLPEILGDAALYFDPASTPSFLKALDAIVYDQELRKKMMARGAVQAQKYSWKHMGEEVVQLYGTLEKQYTKSHTTSFNAPT